MHGQNHIKNSIASFPVFLQFLQAVSELAHRPQPLTLIYILDQS